MTAAPEAVVLAGGRATRLGGAAKPALTVGGASLLARTVAALRAAGVTGVVVAGPTVRDVSGVQWVREDPPFGGPVAGLAAALPRVTAPEVLVLPADLVDPAGAVRALRESEAAADGVCLVDGEGRRQWLTGRYRTAALREALAGLPAGGRDAAMRAVLGGLSLAEVTGAAADVDTWDHLRQARRLVGAREETVMPDETSRTLPPEALEDWARALRERFGLTEDDLPIALILDLAREVATGVARPAAPFSAYVAGLVAGRAGGSPQQVREAVAEITAMAKSWDGR